MWFNSVNQFKPILVTFFFPKILPDADVQCTSLPVQLQKAVLSCRMYCTFNTWCVHSCNRKGNNKIAILKKDHGRKISVSTALFSSVVRILTILEPPRNWKLNKAPRFLYFALSDSDCGEVPARTLSVSHMPWILRAGRKHPELGNYLRAQTARGWQDCPWYPGACGSDRFAWGLMLSEGKAPTGSGCTGEDGPACFLVTQAAFNGSGSLACPVGNLSTVLLRCYQM